MDSEKHNDGEDTAACRPVEALAWFQEKLASGDRIGMPEFCQEFGFTHDQDAHAAFSYPLFSSELPRSARTKLSKEYEEWCRNEGAEYWAFRITDYKIEVSAKKTAGNLVDRSDLLAWKASSVFNIRFDDNLCVSRIALVQLHRPTVQAQVSSSP
jgi:hypothetical protein